MLFLIQNFKETTECGLHVEDDESYPIQIPQFPNDDIIETPEYNNYRFNPVIENIEEDVSNEDLTFPRSEIPSNYFNTHFLSSQQSDNNISIPSISSLGGALQKGTRANLFYNEPNSEKYFGNSNKFIEVLKQRFQFWLKCGRCRKTYGSLPFELTTN